MYDSDYDQPLYDIDIATTGTKLNAREKCLYAAMQTLRAGSVMVFSTNKKWSISNAKKFLSLLKKQDIQLIPVNEKLNVLIE